jgi:hypothetical protein
MERAMGIEQIRMNQTRRYHPLFSPMGVKSRMNVNFGHHKGVYAWHREANGICDGRWIIKHGLQARLAQEQLSAVSKFIGCKGCGGSGRVE